MFLAFTEHRGRFCRQAFDPCGALFANLLALVSALSSPGVSPLPDKQAGQTKGAPTGSVCTRSLFDTRKAAELPFQASGPRSTPSSALKGDVASPASSGPPGFPASKTPTTPARPLVFPLPKGSPKPGRTLAATTAAHALVVKELSNSLAAAASAVADEAVRSSH